MGRREEDRQYKIDELPNMSFKKGNGEKQSYKEN